MVDYKMTATIAVNQYLWERLSKELGWKNLGNGLRPIFPVQEQPEAASQTGPYMVYSYSLSPMDNIYGYHEEQVTYTLFSDSEATIREALNFMHAIFSKYDLSGEDVNTYLAHLDNEKLNLYDFKSVDVLASMSAQPADSEGGRMDGAITIRCRYTYYGEDGSDPRLQPYKVTT